MNIKRVFTLLSFTLLLASGHAQSQNLVDNGDFEAGLASWTIWATSDGFWTGSWLMDNDCDIWVPTNGCPYEGSISYSQKKGNDTSNAHGGIYQVLNVKVGRTYNVAGFWSGGVTGNVDGNNGTWWEIAIYDGNVNGVIIDQAPNNPPRTKDALIAKKEKSNLGNLEVYQFQWEPFDGTFVAKSDTVTLAFKNGSYYTYDAAGYLDLVSVELVNEQTSTSVPTLPLWALIALSGLLIGSAGLMKARRRQMK